MIHKSRKLFEYSRTYIQSLLDKVSQAQQDGLSLEEAKEKFPFEKEPSDMRRYFYLPENKSEKHLETIETIWGFLQAKGASPEPAAVDKDPADNDSSQQHEH